MHLAESLVLPTELERARSTGELVVFAGAGVSIGPPSNCPSFTELARHVAGPGLTWDGKEALDRYLGRAERVGIKVQDRTRAFLNDRGSHNPLHEHLIGIFGAPQHVRLITTNFDSHFTEAVKQVFAGSTIPHYIGPALPPGSAFTGIAHLHGASGHDQDRLVLTDRDFAEAYMAEGWAARFLMRVFADRTILLVGYSLRDVIMQYLLHALPPTDRWFALWHESETPDTEHSIIPIPFRTSSNGDKFGDLTSGMRRWHWYASAQPSDHENELRDIISSGPPISPLDADYVRARLETDAGRILFWTLATDGQWFEWASVEGFLDGLTEAHSGDSLIVRWCRWCLSNFANGDTPPLLRFLRGRSTDFHPAFVSELNIHLCTCDPLPPRPVMRQFIALIVNYTGSLANYQHEWEWLLKRLLGQQYYEEAVVVLRAATRIQCEPIQRLFEVYEKHDWEDSNDLPPLFVGVRTSIPSAGLMEVLQEHGDALAAANADSMLALGKQRLVEASELLDLAGGSRDALDWLSCGRTAISESNQDTSADAEDVLIVLVRTVVDHWAGEDLRQLRAFAQSHEQNEIPILRRLALYAYAKCAECESDDILERATAQGWARDVWVRPEFYLLLAIHYPRISEKKKGEFIVALQDDQWWGKALAEEAIRIRFDLSQKLLRDAPESACTIAFADSERRAHPKWQERDPDGYLSRVEVGWRSGDELSPSEPVEMLELSPDDAVAHLVAEGADTGGSHGLLGALHDAATSNPEWGLDVLLALMRTEDAADRMASALLTGLRAAHVSDSLRLQVLNELGGAEWLPQVASSVGTLLEGWSRDVTKDADPALLEGLDTAADALYQASMMVAPNIEGTGWTEASRYHPAAHAVRTWWRVAEARDWVDGEFVITLDGSEKARCAMVVHDDSNAGAYSRPILGMLTDRLSKGDAPWTATAIFPWFDPRTDRDRSAQLWDGRLMQHRWSWTTVEGLRPYFEFLFSESMQLLPARSVELGGWLAMLAAHPEKSGLTLSLLHAFVQHAADEARVAFAKQLPRHLETLTPGARMAVWDKLIQRYWDDRCTNVPAPLATKEVGAMCAWVFALPEVAAEALAKLRSSPGERFMYADTVIRKWQKDDAWVCANPTEAAGFIEFLTERNSLTSWMTQGAVVVLEKALEAGASQDIVLNAAERLVALSCPTAPALVERVSGAS